MSYSTKAACLQALLNARGAGRLGLSEVAERLPSSNFPNWGNDAGSYVGRHDSVVTSASLPTTGDLPSQTHYPPYADQNALVTAVRNAAPGPGLTDVLMRLSGTLTSGWGGDGGDSD